MRWVHGKGRAWERDVPLLRRQPPASRATPSAPALTLALTPPLAPPSPSPPPSPQVHQRLASTTAPTPTEVGATSPVHPRLALALTPPTPSPSPRQAHLLGGLVQEHPWLIAVVLLTDVSDEVGTPPPTAPHPHPTPTPTPTLTPTHPHPGGRCLALTPWHGCSPRRPTLGTRCIYSALGCAPIWWAALGRRGSAQTGADRPRSDGEMVAPTRQGGRRLPAPPDARPRPPSRAPVTLTLTLA